MTRNGEPISLSNPPQHCGGRMATYTSADSRTGAYDVVCEEDNYTLHTDHDGVVLGQGRR